MNNLTSRANVILANSLSVLAICTGMLFLSTLYIPVEPKFDFKVRSSQNYTKNHQIINRSVEFVTCKVFSDYFARQINDAQLRYQPDHMSGKREYLDLTLFRYDLKVDMSDSFHWNVKMLFLYLVAEYTNEKNSVNQVCGPYWITIYTK